MWSKLNVYLWQFAVLNDHTNHCDACVAYGQYLFDNLNLSKTTIDYLAFSDYLRPTSDVIAQTQIWSRYSILVYSCVNHNSFTISLTFYFYFLQANKNIPEKLTNGIQIGINYRLCAAERVGRSTSLFRSGNIISDVSVYTYCCTYHNARRDFTGFTVGNVQKWADTIVQIATTRRHGLWIQRSVVQGFGRLGRRAAQGERTHQCCSFDGRRILVRVILS